MTELPYWYGVWFAIFIFWLHFSQVVQRRDIQVSPVRSFSNESNGIFINPVSSINEKTLPPAQHQTMVFETKTQMATAPTQLGLAADGCSALGNAAGAAGWSITQGIANVGCKYL